MSWGEDKIDLAPEGFIHLPDCFERYCQWLWKGHYPRDEADLSNRWSNLPGERQLAHRALWGAVTDAAFAEVVRLFADGELNAIVRQPGTIENLTIPPRAWRDAFFPERMFLSAEIREGHGDYFDAAIGRTPFVKAEAIDVALRNQEPHRSKLSSRSHLRDALIGLVMDGVMSSREAESFKEAWGLRPLAEHPDPAAFNPMRLPAWTLVMAVAWIAWRDMGRVREAWDDYRKECWAWFGFRRRASFDGGGDLVATHQVAVRGYPSSAQAVRFRSKAWLTPMLAVKPLAR